MDPRVHQGSSKAPMAASHPISRELLGETSPKSFQLRFRGMQTYWYISGAIISLRSLSSFSWCCSHRSSSNTGSQVISMLSPGPSAIVKFVGREFLTGSFSSTCCLPSLPKLLAFLALWLGRRPISGTGRAAGDHSSFK